MATPISQLKATATVMATKTLSIGLLVWNETTKRWHGGDGVTVGGIPMAKYDERNENSLGYAAVTKTDDYAITIDDTGKMLVANKATAIAFSLPAAATLTGKFVAVFKNIGAGTLTISATGTETIDGLPGIVVDAGATVFLKCDGATFRSFGNSTFAAAIHAATAKPAPVDQDELGIWDSVSGLLRKVTFSSLVERLQKLIGPSYLKGLITSKSSAFVISTAAGEIKGNGLFVANTAAFSKNLNAVWVAGAGNGGRLEAAAIVANKTYHLHALMKNSDGSFDWGFSTSATAPTIPAGYSWVGRFWAVYVNSANTAIIDYIQEGNWFFSTPVLWVTSSAITAAVYTVPTSVPLPDGIQVNAHCEVNGVGASGNYATVLIGHVTSSGIWSGTVGVNDAGGASGVSINVPAAVANNVRTSAARQLYLSINAAGGGSMSVFVGGWEDFTLNRIY